MSDLNYLGIPKVDEALWDEVFSALGDPAKAAREGKAISCSRWDEIMMKRSPVPAKRDPSLGPGQRAKRTSATNKARGQAVPPANPTGRLVIDPGQKGVSAHSVHWCPKEGTRWTCPDCGREFVRDEDKRGEPWRAFAVTPSGATASPSGR